MATKKEAKTAAAHIAARAGVSVYEVMRAYRKAARGAAVNAKMLFIEQAANIQQ